MLYSSFRPLYLCTFASVRVIQTSKAVQTTAIRTVANSLPKNEVILLTILISRRYIPYTDLRKNFKFIYPVIKIGVKNLWNKSGRVVALRKKAV